MHIILCFLYEHHLLVAKDFNELQLQHIRHKISFGACSVLGRGGTGIVV